MKLSKTMKNFLKSLLRKNNLILIAIFLLAAGVRFYNFPNRVTFWSEQARSLIVSGNYIKEKFSLLGQEYFREDSNGHILYSGALFNYLLVPLLIISNYRPVTITVFFALLNLFTGFVIYWAIKRLYSVKLAILSLVLFLFNDFMIYHSLFIWNYNFLPIIGILTFYFSILNYRKPSTKNIFLLGLLSGIGISLQFLFILIALPVLVFNVWRNKKYVVSVALFVLGMALGNLPMLLFDLRHNFYHLRTLTQYLIDTLQGKSGASFSYYYLLPFWPVFALIGAWLIKKILRLNVVIGIVVLLLYFYFNLTSVRVLFNGPTGMPKGITVSDIDKASIAIANDTKSDFNVSEVLDFDKRAYVLRYFVEYEYGKKPLGVTEYPNLKLLYVLAQTEYNFDKSDIWEIKSGGSYNVTMLTDVGRGYAIYKLTK